MVEPPELHALVYDHHSGAREITARLLQLLQRQVTQSKAAHAGALLDEVASTCIDVLRAHPEMASVFNTADGVLRQAEAQEDAAEDVGAVRMGLMTVLNDELADQDSRLAAAARHAADTVQNGDVVLTYSRSSTVLEALRAAKEAGRVFDVVLTEGRPLLEGRALARELAQLQIPVRVYVDAAALVGLEESTRVMIGCDAVTRDGIVNKVGTRAVAQAAHEAGIPVDVVTQATKAWRRATDAVADLRRGRPREPVEVWDKAPVGVDVRNVTYDVTPCATLRHVVCEAGVGSFDAFWKVVTAQGASRRLRAAFPRDVG